VAHRNARTTVYARQLIVERRRAGWPPAQIAEQRGISRATVHKWIARHDAEGEAGLADRSSRPHTSPTRTCPQTEARVLELRTQIRRGAVSLAGDLGLVASTVGRTLHRHAVPRWPRSTRSPASRCGGGTAGSATNAPNPLTCSMSMSKSRPGSRRRAGGCTAAAKTAGAARSAAAASATTTSTWPSMTVPGWPTSKPCPTNATSPARSSSTVPWPGSDRGVAVLRVLTDNAKVYRVGQNWRAVCIALGLRRRFIKPGCPWTNGKAERFNWAAPNFPDGCYRS
jgi:hypothetical protein